MFVDLIMTLGVPRASRDLARRSILAIENIRAIISCYKNMLTPLYSGGGMFISEVRKDLFRVVQKRKEEVIRFNSALRAEKNISLAGAAGLLKKVRNSVIEKLFPEW
jgi:hypothetical protein